MRRTTYHVRVTCKQLTYFHRVGPRHLKSRVRELVKRYGEGPYPVQLVRFLVDIRYLCVCPHEPSGVI